VSLALLVLVVLVFALAGFHRGNPKPEIAARVGSTSIQVLDVNALVEHARGEMKREGKPVPERGSEEYKALQDQALGLLIYHEELVQAGGALGISVSEKEITARIPGSGEAEGGGVSVAGDLAYVREGIRGSLLYRRIYARITRDIEVSPRAVRAYYRAHAATYRRQRRSFESARVSIADDLRDTKRNAAMARWIERMKTEFADKVAYSPAFRS
jgi:hypothetical protein